MFCGPVRYKAGKYKETYKKNLVASKQKFLMNFLPGSRVAAGWACKTHHTQMQKAQKGPGPLPARVFVSWVRECRVKGPASTTSSSLLAAGSAIVLLVAGLN